MLLPRRGTLGLRRRVHGWPHLEQVLIRPRGDGPQRAKIARRAGEAQHPLQGRLFDREHRAIHEERMAAGGHVLLQPGADLRADGVLRMEHHRGPGRHLRPAVVGQPYWL